MTKTYEVQTTLIVHCKVKVLVEAEGPDAAIDAAAELLPASYNDRSRLWSASVTLQPPKGVTITACKPYYFEQASGGEKAKKVSS